MKFKEHEKGFEKEEERNVAKRKENLIGKMLCPKCGYDQLKLEVKKGTKLKILHVTCGRCGWNSMYRGRSRDFLGVGLVGCGAIGTVLAHAIDEGKAGDARLFYLYDLDISKCEKLAKQLSHKPLIAETFSELIECEDVDLVIEAASQEAVRQYALRTLQAGKDLMIMSVGALVDTRLTEKIRSLIKGGKRRVYLPSGAIAGLDGLKAATIGRIDEVTLRTRKPPRGLSDAPYIKEKKIDLNSISEMKTIYEGSAEEACKLFPKNVNVAAALSLAGVGPKKTKVQIVVDPTIQKNIHEIDVKGEFGELTVRTQNVVSPINPKTSALAVLSAIATLKKITEGFQIGT
ncbi:MAG: aspartate dehydrogenase [Candidatus Bathyarchaeia archaeon]